MSLILASCMLVLALLAGGTLAADSPPTPAERMRALEAGGAASIDDALQWLANPESVGVVQTDKSEWRDGEFSLLMHWLDGQLEQHPERIPDAVRALQPYMRHPGEYIRARAYRMFAEYVPARAMPRVRAGLEDESDVVVRGACYALMQALEAGRLSPETGRSLWPSLERAARRPVGDHRSKPAELMLELDRARATAYLLRDEFLSLDNPGLTRGLDALGEAGVLAPRERLLALLQQVGQPAPTFKNANTRAWSAALKHLGQHRDPRDEVLIRRYLDDPNPTIAAVGTWAMLAWADLEEPELRVERRFYAFLEQESDDDISRANQRAFEKLSEPEQHIFATSAVRTAINFNGVSGMLVNSSGQWLMPAIKGAEAMGAKREAAFFREIAAVFGEGGVPTDWDARHEAMGNFTPEQEARLKTLDRVWFDKFSAIEGDLDLTTRLQQYAIEHRDAIGDVAD